MLEPLSSWDSEATWATFMGNDFHQFIGGQEAQKTKDDLDRYDRIIRASRPDVVIETGTRHGGSALWFAGRGLEVITMDLNPEGWRPSVDWAGGITCLRGHSSTELPAESVDYINDAVAGKRVMVSLDSDHHAPHVDDEILSWGPYVTSGCYLVIEDACFDMWTGQRARLGGGEIPERGGPLKAINEIEERADNWLTTWFERDETIEGMTPVSHSPVGWWRRR